MTVKDIFALRKQGKIEEAYEAIRPIYREHKGKYFAMKSKTAPTSSVLASSAGEAGSPAYSAFRASPAATVPAGSPAVPSAQVPVPSPALSGFSRLQCVPRFPRSHCACWFSSGAEPWPAGSSRLHSRESRPPRSDDI